MHWAEEALTEEPVPLPIAVSTNTLHKANNVPQISIHSPHSQT